MRRRLQRMRRNSSSSDSTLVWVAVAAAGAYVFDLPTGVRAFVDARIPGLAGLLPTSSTLALAPTTSGSPAPTSAGAPDDATIVRWAESLRIPPCVGRRFVGERGRLPGSIDELVAWGNQNGLRDPTTQIWHC